MACAARMPGTDAVRETEGHRLTVMTPAEAAAQDAEEAAVHSAPELPRAAGAPSRADALACSGQHARCCSDMAVPLLLHDTALPIAEGRQTVLLPPGMGRAGVAALQSTASSLVFRV